MTKLQAISGFLRTIEPGQVPADKLRELAAHLAEVWDDLQGSSDGGMTGNKLLGRVGSERPSRIEDARWEPPNLKFRIERHGAVVLGSKYAEDQSWIVDFSTEWAVLQAEKRRLIRPAARRLDVKALADERSKKILSGEEDPALIRRADRTVKILVGKIIKAGSTAKATLTGRRKRFRIALEKNLHMAGWTQTSLYVFKPGEGER